MANPAARTPLEKQVEVAGGRVPIENTKMPSMSLKVLVLSRNYPSNVMPTMGLWVEGLVRHLGGLCEALVVAPVPYCPPLPRFLSYTRVRHILLRHQVNGVEVWHPRFMTGPGYSLHSFEATLYYWSIRRHVDQLRRNFAFDVIHAHFSYPDGVAAARLGRRYQVPVLITEHAPWLPWMEDYPRVRRQALWGAGECTFHIAVSRYVRNTIARFTGQSQKLRVIPVGVDGSTFTSPSNGAKPDANLILYVGRIHHTKGVDVLLRAMRRLIDWRPAARLVLMGGSLLSRQYQQQEERLRRFARDLGLEHHADFVGMRSHSEVAALMRKSALLVLPSRAESFGAVLVEALACGTPVVATRCGGPEDIVNDQVGVLVPVEDVEALAVAIDRVLNNRDQYNSAYLRNYALENFSWERIARRTVRLYQQALDRVREQASRKSERPIAP